MVCPTNIVRGFCVPVVLFDVPEVFDNCVVNLNQLQQIAGLSSGASFPQGVTTQTFRYTDTGGNSSTCSFTVTVEPATVLNYNATEVTCNGACDGTASIMVTGEPPFGIAWSNGASSESVTNLCEGTYSVVVTDGNGCTTSRTISILQPQVLGINITQIEHDPMGTSSGSIGVNIVGGTAPYNYIWTRNGIIIAITEDLTGITAGMYILTVTDAHGCTAVSIPLNITSTVATTEIGVDFGINIFPNPASDEAFVTFSNTDVQPSMIQIMDTQGRMLREQAIAPISGAQLRIPLENLPTGLLVIRFTDGKHTVAKRLMKF